MTPATNACRWESVVEAMTQGDLSPEYEYVEKSATLCQPSRQMGNGKRKQAIRTCRCMISFAIDSMGAADDGCVGDGLVGEGGRTMRSSVSEMDSHGAHIQDEEEVSAIDTHQITSLETPGAGGSSWQYQWSKLGNP